MSFTTRRACSTPLTLLITIATPLAACSSRISEAEERYEMVKKSSASAAEVCAQGRALVDAHLTVKDLEGYRQSQLTTDIECRSRTFDERMGIFRDSDGNVMAPIEADNLSAL